MKGSLYWACACVRRAHPFTRRIFHENWSQVMYTMNKHHDRPPPTRECHLHSDHVRSASRKIFHHIVARLTHARTGYKLPFSENFHEYVAMVTVNTTCLNTPRRRCLSSYFSSIDVYPACVRASVSDYPSA